MYMFCFPLFGRAGCSSKRRDSKHNTEVSSSRLLAVIQTEAEDWCDSKKKSRSVRQSLKIDWMQWAIHGQSGNAECWLSCLLLDEPHKLGSISARLYLALSEIQAL